MPNDVDEIENEDENETETETRSAEWYSIADIVSYLAAVSRGMPSIASNPRNFHPFRVAIRLLRDVAMLHGYNDADGNYDETCEHQEESYADDDSNVADSNEDGGDNKCTGQGDILVQRIRTNDPKLTTLALRNVRVLDRGQPVSSFRGFTQNSIQQATEALQTNHTIRSVSCRYDWRYPKRILHLLRSSSSSNSNYNIIGEKHRDVGTPTKDGLQNFNCNYNCNYNCNTRATPTTSFHTQVTKLQERRFFEACVCLPHLESISLTGGNRWRISHLITILETAKGLKKLTVQDVLIKSSSEPNALKRLLLLLGSTRSNSSNSRRRRRRNYDRRPSLLLETIELTIEDQTDRNDKYWSPTASMANDESPFDSLMEALIVSPNVKEIKLSKSILSRFHLRPAHDISTKTLLKLARCQSLSKLFLSGISVEQGGIEAMCESLIQTNGHLTHLEFYGCAFNHSVGQAGWNAMFRLIDHDASIQIRASSLVYLQQRCCRRHHQHRPKPGNVDTSKNTEMDPQQSISNDSPEEEGMRELGLSAFLRRPREDFSFSLRDKDGAKRHFRNRGLDIQYMLQEAGFYRLLRAETNKHPNRGAACSSDWIDVMAKVGDDSIALFCILRENPALCDRKESIIGSSPNGHIVNRNRNHFATAALLRGDNSENENDHETKRR
jgi:hypothetical protein